MLVLNRREGERLTVICPTGERLQIVVKAIDGARIRLGFTGAESVKIWRTELLERIEAERRES